MSALDELLADGRKLADELDHQDSQGAEEVIRRLVAVVEFMQSGLDDFWMQAIGRKEIDRIASGASLAKGET